MQAIDHIEVRYRRSDTVGAWTTFPLLPGQTSQQLPTAGRGETYQIEARSVGKNGAASVWVQQTHTVANASSLPFAPSTLTALSVADGVHLTWVVNGTQRADVEYDVQRTNDVGGAPNAAGWVNIANVKANAYTDGLTDGVVRWYRVRAVDFQENVSSFSNDTSSQNKSVQDGADVTAAQPIATTGLGSNLIPNGNFLLGNIDGWVPDPAWLGGNGYNSGGMLIGAGGSAVSRSFNTVPGQKYRLSFTGRQTTPGTQSVFHRILYGSQYSANILTTVPGYVGSFNFLSSGSLVPALTTYPYEWTCPPGVEWASLGMYETDMAAVLYTNISAQDYGAADEWGADKTGNNISAGFTGQGALATINQANTVNIVAGAVNSNIVAQSSLQVVVAADGAEHILAQATISTNGGYVKIASTMNVAAGANTHNLIVSLRKGGATGPVMCNMNDVAIVDAPAGSASVSLLAVDAMASTSQQYTVTANAGFSTTCFCNSIVLVVENAKV